MILNPTRYALAKDPVFSLSGSSSRIKVEYTFRYVYDEIKMDDVTYSRAIVYYINGTYNPTYSMFYHRDDDSIGIAIYRYGLDEWYYWDPSSSTWRYGESGYNMGADNFDYFKGSRYYLGSDYTVPSNTEINDLIKNGTPVNWA